MENSRKGGDRRVATSRVKKLVARDHRRRLSMDVERPVRRKMAR